MDDDHLDNHQNSHIGFKSIKKTKSKMKDGPVKFKGSVRINPMVSIPLHIERIDRQHTERVKVREGQ